MWTRYKHIISEFRAAGFSERHATVQVGYQVAAANFFYYAAIIFLLILISETLGMLCSGAFRAELTGAIVLQALYVPLLMFVGFFQVRAASFNTAHGSLLTLQSSAGALKLRIAALCQL